MIRTKHPLRRTKFSVKAVRVKIIKNKTQRIPESIASIQNFQIMEIEGWDVGKPLGGGATLEDAVRDFKRSWRTQYHEPIEVIKMF